MHEGVLYHNAGVHESGSLTAGFNAPIHNGSFIDVLSNKLPCRRPGSTPGGSSTGGHSKYHHVQALMRAASRRVA
eukprot:1152546-Pelagomonas_calceolata.AAC.1